MKKKFIHFKKNKEIKGLNAILEAFDAYLHGINANLETIYDLLVEKKQDTIEHTHEYVTVSLEDTLSNATRK